MKSVAIECVCAVAFLFASSATMEATDAVPSIEQLIASVPNLSTDNEQLSSFRFTFETLLIGETKSVTHFFWCKPDVYGMAVTIGQEKTPVVFLAQKRGIIFDAVSCTGIVDSDLYPQCRIQATDTDLNMQMFGFGSKAEVAIDLPSLLRDPRNAAQMDRDEAGNWRVTTPSPSGKSRFVTVFENIPGYPIRSLELRSMRSMKDDPSPFVIRNISINDLSHRDWPDFPDVENFPKGLKVVDFLTGAVGTPKSVYNVVSSRAAALVVQWAFRDPTMRNKLPLADVDWEKVLKANNEMGPLLREKLKLSDIEQPPIKASPGPVANKNRHTRRVDY
jgi:hypothetical protein